MLLLRERLCIMVFWWLYPMCPCNLYIQIFLLWENVNHMATQALSDTKMRVLHEADALHYMFSPPMSPAQIHFLPVFIALFLSFFSHLLQSFLYSWSFMPAILVVSNPHHGQASSVQWWSPWTRLRFIHLAYSSTWCWPSCASRATDTQPPIIVLRELFLGDYKASSMLSE